MSTYMTEEEQIESIKKLWRQYGHIVTIVLSLVLLAVTGYRYFNWHEEKLSQQASTAYEHMMLALSNQNTKGVKSYANDLIQNHAKTIYADVAHMTLAKVYLMKNKLDKAKEELQVVSSHSKNRALKEIATIRIARILASEKLYPQALKELSPINDSLYLPVINELKGDIYSANGQIQEAMNAYKLAHEEAKNNGMGNLFLEMKTNELAIKSQSMVSNVEDIQST